jgi:hypothetical protein
MLHRNERSLCECLRRAASTLKTLLDMLRVAAGFLTGVRLVVQNTATRQGQCIQDENVKSSKRVRQVARYDGRSKFTHIAECIYNMFPEFDSSHEKFALEVKYHKAVQHVFSSSAAHIIFDRHRCVVLSLKQSSATLPTYKLHIGSLRIFNKIIQSYQRFLWSHSLHGHTGCMKKAITLLSSSLTLTRRPCPNPNRQLSWVM